MDTNRLTFSETGGGNEEIHSLLSRRFDGGRRSVADRRRRRRLWWIEELQRGDEVGQNFRLVRIDQLETGVEEDHVSEQAVEVRMQVEQDDLAEVAVVDVGQYVE